MELWEEEIYHYGSSPGGISIYTLPPLAAVLISLVLGIFMIGFARRQLQDVDLQAIRVQEAAPPPSADPAAPAAAIQSAPPPAAALAGETGIAAFFTPSVQYWAPDIVRWADAWHLDPNLVATVMQIESCGHPQVSSSAGAVGLFQVMPYHFAAGENARNPDTNAYRGLSYLSRSLEAHSGDVYYALAGYNAGIAGSQRGEASWPDETVRYTYWGIGIYRDAVAGKSSSERLAEWLSRGGGLCSRAEDWLGIDE